MCLAADQNAGIREIYLSHAFYAKHPGTEAFIPALVLLARWAGGRHMRLLAIIILSLAPFGWLESATADSWKDESGHGRWHGDYGNGGGYHEKDRKLKFYTHD